MRSVTGLFQFRTGTIKTIKMIRSGATGYILKGAEQEELRLALDEVLKQGYFYNERITRKVMKSVFRSWYVRKKVPGNSV